MSFTQINDVTAVVLTMGEPTTRQAIDSLRRQIMRPREVIVVRGKAPFHKALNTGAAEVKTPFFVQVDADMILDPHCIAALRGNMSRRTGIVVARLRDALIEQVVGVKLFLSKCFESEVFQIRGRARGRTAVGVVVIDNLPAHRAAGDLGDAWRIRRRLRRNGHCHGPLARSQSKDAFVIRL